MQLPPVCTHYPYNKDSLTLFPKKEGAKLFPLLLPYLGYINFHGSFSYRLTSIFWNLNFKL